MPRLGTIGHASKIDRLRVVRVDKVSSLAFLHAADEVWRRRESLLIGDNNQLGIAPARALTLTAGGGWWEGDFQTDRSDDIAQISSTSGTTGEPKAIALSRRAVSDTVDRLVRHMELDAGIREYIGVPVTFSFGLARARAVAAAGGAAFVPETGFRPDELAAMLRSGEINALSAVPTMLRTILAHPDIVGDAGKRLRWLETGSQFMAEDEKRAVRSLFSEAVILQHYGLTEASRTTFLRIDTANDAALASVGRAADGGAVRIGDGGRIEVRGPHLASGMIVQGALTPITGTEGWLRTADLGELRGEWLHYLGRADDVANIGGIKVSADLFERLLAERIGSAEGLGTCVVGDGLRGEKLAIACRPGALAEVTAAARVVAAQQGLRPADLTIAEINDLPLTDTGKLQRHRLSERFVQTAPVFPADTQTLHVAETLSSREAEIAAIWADALGIADVGRDDSFHDLGGDSLSAVSVMIRAQQVGVPPDIMQRMFAGETVAQIAAALDGGEGDATTKCTAAARGDIRAIRADALNAVRGLFALLIVISHWGPFFIERMGVAGRAIWAFAGPLLRIGTPGFAMVYGMGLGLFFFGQLERGQERLRIRIRTNTRILVMGVLLVAAAQAWRLVATGTGFGPIWPEQLFYEVLLFYALTVPTSLFWLRLIASSRDPVFGSLMLATGAYAVHAACAALLPVNPFTGWASLGWHMLVAPYAYPRLLAAVALGLAMALWLQRCTSSRHLVEVTAKWGLALGGLGALLLAFSPGGWTQNAGSLLAIPAFAGIATLLYSAAARMASGGGGKPLAMKLAIVCGMLAFPIFIGQGIVLPAKAALVAYGLPDMAATLAPVLLFAGVMMWLGRRIYRLMFAVAKKH